MARYYMPIPEAAHLVLQASVMGRHGETLIIDMGTPVRIIAVARHIIQRSGQDISNRFTELRLAEKFDEVLVSERENIAATAHPLNYHIRVSPMALGNVALTGLHNHYRALLKSLVPGDEDLFELGARAPDGGLSPLE